MSKLMQLVYLIIYQPFVNSVLRRLNKIAKPLTSFRLPPSGTITLNFGSGVKFKMETNQTSHVTQFIYWNGPNSFEYTKIFIKLIKGCNSFIDIGANTGYYSILAGAINHHARVHAFEPAEGPFYYLNRNININNLNGRVLAHRIALSDQAGEINFYQVKSKKYKNVKYPLGGTGSLKKDEAKQSRLVETLSLDDFVRKHTLLEVDLIKVDTEGTEDIILNGSTNVIERFKPIIICEILFNNIESKLEKIMTDHNYYFFKYMNGELVKVETIVREVDDGIRDCFFVHPSRLDYLNTLIS